MNKKGIIALVVVIVLVVVGFMVFGNNKSTTVTNTTGNTTGTTDTNTTPKTPVPAGVTKDTYKPVTKDTTDTSLLGRLKSTSIGISEDGKKIGFSGGVATFTSEGSSDKTSAKIGDVAISKVQGSRNDVLSTVSLTTAGVTSTYLVLFQDNGATAGLEDKSFAVVGTGITVTGIRADSVADNNVDYVVSVSYTDSKKAAHSKIFVVAGGIFDLNKTIEL